MFTRAYEIANDLGERDIIENTRVVLGIAVAHTVFGTYSECMDNLDKANVQRLLDFKSARVESFTEEGQGNYFAGISSKAGRTKSEDSSVSSFTHASENPEKSDSKTTDSNVDNSSSDHESN